MFKLTDIVPAFRVLGCTLALALSGLVSTSHAAGMIPDTTIVLINAADREGSINVTNTDTDAALLHTNLENIPEDQQTLLVVNPPITRVEAGQKQMVRFIVQSAEPITTQRLKRVTFEGIPQRKASAGSTLTMNVRQNLPVIIHPEGLPMKSDPWTLLKWIHSGDTLNVSNDSPYVVRLHKQLMLSPGNGMAELPNPYILPGQTFSLALTGDTTSSPSTSVRFTPASLYGFALDPVDTPLN